MGLFDKMFGTQSQVEDAFSPAEAFAAITLAATASDGYLSEEEARAISSTLSRMRLFRSYSNDVMIRMFDKLLAILRREGIDVLFNAAKESLPGDLREAAFAVATDLVLADGVVSQEERDFLNDLYQALGISSDIATQIVQVMLIKNRG
ncbi:tellurite resistance TerB family protein [Fischerella thermalis]|jgi:tellurite resistance protein|uniref:tellurite resistance TerB family protein n=1 Tax=Fischerella thermalis TaxID=372787 RepID=UPI000C80B55A|nr:tellurite resistance TerB family protein [Fischerella thermalis]PLZ12136.1 Tellurite resistance protein TerB [Fischerella thermalis WC114]PLZ14401.1 Tellurite resistance protein TerB [Fischerella thermalis WC119]PLZ18257.1 Tellurite resistance protein TerB [Fischerella thermalis WC1110]PLZ25182.1 Tellurite resistance protein TerB [Fischerella thermalis WC157]PLZ27062.1 Tellurite resistance protein TerB [Fischerella thermalis WC341]